MRFLLSAAMGVLLLVAMAVALITSPAGPTAGRHLETTVNVAKL
jgi:hypothetical protein